MEGSSITIRPFQDSDAQESCQVITAASLPHWKEDGLSNEVIQELRARNNPDYLIQKATSNHFFVTEDTNTHKIVGIIGLRNDGESPIPNRLSTFFIHPDYQGKGIGRKLYEQVKNEALRLGCKKLVVSSSPYAESIYVHFGFKKIRVDWKEYENGIRSYNVWMEQNLD